MSHCLGLQNLVLKIQPPRDFQCQGLAVFKIPRNLPFSKCGPTLWVMRRKQLPPPLASPSPPPQLGLPRWFSGKKNTPDNAGAAGDRSSVFGLGRSPGGGNCYLLQYSCLRNPMDRRAWWAIVHGVTESLTQLNNWASTAHLPNTIFHLSSHKKEHFPSQQHMAKHMQTEQIWI